MEDHQVTFQQTYLMYLVSTMLCPTTSNHVSNRCYPIMLLYVDSLDVIGIEDLESPKAKFAVNRWLRENVDKVLLADQIDKSSYRNIELKTHLGINYRLFGGANGFSEWIDTSVDPRCSNEKKARVANLIGIFSGMFGLMTSLVQGWTSMEDNVQSEVGCQFGVFSEGFVRGGSSDAAPRLGSPAPAPRPTRAGARKKNVASTTVPDAGTSSGVPLSKDPVGGRERSPSKEVSPPDMPYRDSSEEDVNMFVRVSRKCTVIRRKRIYNF